MKEAVNSLEGTVEEKLDAVRKAIRRQTVSLAGKLDLIEGAIEAGLADNAAAINLVKEAVNSLEGTVEEKLEAVRKAIRRQTVSLAGKLDLIDATIKAGFADNVDAIGLVEEAVNSLEGTMETKLDVIRKAINKQTKELGQKMNLIRAAVKNGFVKNADAIDLVKQAVESLEGTMKEKLDAINETIISQTNTLSEKLAAIEGAIQSGLVGEDSTLGLVKKAIDALNSTAGTANEKLEAIKNAIDSPTSGLNVKLEAIEEALAKGLIDVTEKQDLILAAINSASTYHFTDDELLEKGQDYLLVDAAFWEANHENYEVVRALKELIKLSVPHKYKFWWQQTSGKYAFSGYEPTSFYGPLWSEGGILKGIAGSSGVILAADLGRTGASPSLDRKNGHTCYYLKKVHKSCQYYFHVKVGDRADGKNLKVKDMNDRDTFRVLPLADGNYLEYVHWTEAVKSTTGVWGFNNLKYLANLIPDNSVEFIFVEDN